MSSFKTLNDFRNEPFTDFQTPAARAAMEKALADVRHQLGRTYSLIIDGKKVASRRSFPSINPSRFKEIIGRASDADRSQADRALAVASKTFESWSRQSDAVRAQALQRMAAILRRRKYEFCAWMIYEVGKSWTEADADVCEAIDFLEYYALCALVPMPQLTPIPSEKNTYVARPLGPVVVIPPWNFPLAILVGMATAAVAAGNTVVIKPSSQSPVIAAKFMEIVEEAGVPAGVMNLVTGAGGRIGDVLVQDSRTRMIAFTGSKAVGEHVNERAAVPAKGQRWIKRVIAEMGGKNAIVVDASADLEAAAQGVMVSAFGFQGQKCSACSRAYIHEAVYNQFVEKLMARVEAIRQGPAYDPANFMGPVISDSAMKSILAYMQLGKKQGKTLSGANALRAEGFYLAPTVFERLPASSRLWKEEVFGPLLALGKVKSFAEGLHEANNTDFGLTGAVFSRDEKNLEYARREFFCGNLYFNRKCTGAMVGGHPFGGFNLSGTDSKAGGPDYLALFRQMQCISEKLA